MRKSHAIAFAGALLFAPLAFSGGAAAVPLAQPAAGDAGGAGVIPRKCGIVAGTAAIAGAIAAATTLIGSGVAGTLGALLPPSSSSSPTLIHPQETSWKACMGNGDFVVARAVSA